MLQMRNASSCCRRKISDHTTDSSRAAVALPPSELHSRNVPLKGTQESQPTTQVAQFSANNTRNA